MLRLYCAPTVSMTKFDPKIHHRRSIRLKGYDYTSAGAYFVTVVTYQRDRLFGDITNEEMRLSGLGKVADECWRSIPEHFPSVELGAHIVMPNHVHGIIVIHDDGSGAGDRGKGAAMLRPNVKPGSLGAIVRSYKSAVSYRANKELNMTAIWQRNYYEHIIRNEKELDNIWRYIESNPARWEEDEENPNRR